MNKRYGFTLVEIVVSMALGMMVLSICTKLCVDCIRKYNKYIEETNVINELEETILNMSRIVRERHVQTIDAKDNRIITNTLDNSYEVIYKSNYKLYIDYISFDAEKITKTTTKVIGEGIDSFEVTKKKKLIYITIKKGEFSITRCL